jgi:uncharacterized protein YcbK (DUF882 family)
MVNIKLSPHFSLFEMTATSRKVENTPTVEAIVNLCRLCNEVLEPARKIYGRPIIVTSGYRCPKLNNLVGGVKTSRHLTGQAADLRVESKELGRKLFDALKTLPGIDELLYEHKGNASWIHVAWSEHPRRKINFNYEV